MAATRKEARGHFGKRVSKEVRTHDLSYEMICVLPLLEGVFLQGKVITYTRFCFSCK